MPDSLENRFFVTAYTLLGKTRYRVVDVLTPDEDVKAGKNDFETQEEAETRCAQRNARNR